MNAPELNIQTTSGADNYNLRKSKLKSKFKFKNKFKFKSKFKSKNKGE